MQCFSLDKRIHHIYLCGIFHQTSSPTYYTEYSRSRWRSNCRFVAHSFSFLFTVGTIVRRVVRMFRLLSHFPRSHIIIPLGCIYDELLLYVSDVLMVQYNGATDRQSFRCRRAADVLESR